MRKVELAASWDADFLDRVSKKYHYADADRETLAAVAAQLKAAMEGQAAFWCAEPAPLANDMTPSAEAAARPAEDAMRRENTAQPAAPLCAAVIFTLGAGVDALQDAYTAQEKLTECYMAEAMSSQWMLEHYREVNRWIGAQTGLTVERYRFFGSEEALPLSDMASLLQESGQDTVRANRACLLQPKKSVVFYAQLTEDSGASCEGICSGCRNTACPNRMEGGAEREGRWPDLTGRPLPYGYARILGKG